MLRVGRSWKFPISASRHALRRYSGYSAQSNLMDSFLRDSKKWLQSGPDKVSIVIGNESCDLDSMTSAILFAWFRSDNKPGSLSSKRYVPLLDIPQEDVKLRPEFKALLDACHIDIENLITLTDLPDPNKLPPEHTQWILVDHNKLDSKLNSVYSSQVRGCIDHHEEENSVPTDIESEPRIIEKCGSCTSLVLRELAPQILDEDSDLEHEPKFTSDALKLGIASILIDTNNLKDPHKTTKLDESITSHLDRILRNRSADWNRDTFFDTIAAEEKNLDGLSFNDVLRKDYKEWREGDINLGTSSVVKDLNFVDGLLDSNAEQYAKEASNFMAERELDIWAVMTRFTGNDGGKEGFKRQLRIHWHSEQAGDMIVKFEQQCGGDLKLELATDDKQLSSADMSWKSWQQNNVAASRKQVAPMLRTTIKQYLSK